MLRVRVAKPMWDVCRVVGAVARPEDARLGAGEVEREPALDHVDEFLACVPPMLGECGARLEDEQHGHHLASRVRDEQRDVDALGARMEPVLLARAHDLGVGWIGRRQQVDDGDAEEVHEPDEAGDRDVALAVLDEREERRRDARRLPDLAERQPALEAERTQRSADVQAVLWPAVTGRGVNGWG